MLSQRIVRMVHRPTVFIGLWHFNKTFLSRPDSLTKMGELVKMIFNRWNGKNSFILIPSSLVCRVTFGILQIPVLYICLWLCISLNWIVNTAYLLHWSFCLRWSFSFVSEKCLRLTYFLTETHHCLTVALAFLNIILHSVLFSVLNI